MEFVSGTSLRELIDKGPVEFKRAIEFAEQFCAGLQAAHDERIVHRDLKPENVIIDSQGTVRILDFGLAAVAGASKLTKEASTLGTIHYMSPEQVKGEQIDQRSDIWSLGILLYELLTGAPPFNGDFDQAVIYSILNEAPEPISERRPAVPVGLEQFIQTCLEKDVADRYQQVDQLMPGLRQACKTSSQTSIALRLGTVRRAYVAYLLPAILIGAFVVILAGYMFFGTEAESSEPMPIAVVGFDNMTGDTTFNYLQRAIPNLLITSLEQSPKLQMTTWERLRDLLKQTGRDDTELIDKDLGYELCRMEGINTIVVGSFVKAGNAFTTEVRILDVSSKRLLKGASANGVGEESILISQVDELSEEISKGVGLAETRIKTTRRPIAEVTTSSIEAYNYFLRGREYYEKYYEADAMRLFERAVELDSTFATARIYLARVYWNRGLGQKEHFEEALVYSNATSEKERLFIESDYPGLYWRFGYALALAENYSEAIKILDKHLAMYPHALTWTYRMIGFYQYLQGRVRQALRDLQRASAVADSTGHPYGKARAERLRAWIYYDRGEFDRGLIAMQNFGRGRVEVTPAGESYFKLCLDAFLGLVKAKTGEIDSAKYHLEVMEANLPLNFTKLNEMYDRDVLNLNNLSKHQRELLQAEILLAEGLTEKAIAVVRRAKLVEYPILMHPQIFDGYNLPFKDDISARACQDSGNLDGAITEYERLVSIDPTHRDRRFIPARFHYRLAKLYEKKGLIEKALARYEQFLTVWKDAEPDWPELIAAKARYAQLKKRQKD